VARRVLNGGGMLTHRFRSSPALSLAFALAAAGCGPLPGDGMENVNTDDSGDVPVAAYDEVFGGSPDNDTLPDENKADAIYPPVNIALLAEMSPVRNQARRGVCTIFSTVGLMEHLYIKAGMANPDFSEQYLQWSVKKQIGAFPNGEGSNNGPNLDAINRYGIVDEQTYPYNPENWTGADDPDCAPLATAGESTKLPTKCWTQGDPSAAVRMATKYRLPSGGRYLNTNSIKAHITDKKTAVVVGIKFFYQAWNHRKTTLYRDMDAWQRGIVRYPNAEDIAASPSAGHGILIVGWDDTMTVPMIDGKGQPVLDAAGQPRVEKGFYLFKNSWGTGNFGPLNPQGDGYGWIAQRYVRQYANANVSTAPRLQ
jgi:C1A family cysteine protease